MGLKGEGDSALGVLCEVGVGRRGELPRQFHFFTLQVGASGFSRGFLTDAQPYTGSMCERDCSECSQGEPEESCGGGR